VGGGAVDRSLSRPHDRLRSSGESAPSASTPSSGSGPLVSTASTGIGTVLVAGNGRTVYEFANDRGSMSTCTVACAVDWPPVLAPASTPASVPGVSGKLGSAIRDGSRQLTIASHPVYTFAGDRAPGQTDGQGLTLNGGLWTAVIPSGAPLAGQDGSAPNAPTY
jgi:predicted lipoprotein with Yx(FWY)xxD motif